MAAVEPKLAPVKPRGARGSPRESRPLEDLLLELADELPQGVVLLEGGGGSGRSTALAHVAVQLGTVGHVVFLDEPTLEELAAHKGRLIVTSQSTSAPTPAEWLRVKLVPWGHDELMEYLLATRPEACGSVLARLGDAARRTWSPRLAVIVLERFLADESACDVAAELRGHIRGTVAGENDWRQVCRLCLNLLTGRNLLDAVSELANRRLQIEAAGKLIVPHPELWPMLAAEALLDDLRSDDTVKLEEQLSEELVQLVGAELRNDATVRATLDRLLQSRKQWRRHAMAASLCFAADPHWRPAPRPRRRMFRQGWWLAFGYFRGAAWSEVDLDSGSLWHADFSRARLDGADLRGACAKRANFSGASLVGAKLARIEAHEADFSDANLRGAGLTLACCHGASFVNADLTGAVLEDAAMRGADFSGACLAKAECTKAVLKGAIFEDADLGEAQLHKATLADCDLRTANLQGADFTGAKLHGVQLEDVHWPDAQLAEARFHHAHLTGSRLPRANLRGAVFNGAGLAEISWEDADLRGADLRFATFHMGSSRGGLVNSPIACEGSKTGFYTDDFEDMHFKRPEDIRKANLCGADLRGADIDGLDFYLVDLRDAKLDPKQLDHVRRCGAILGRVLT
jgi:uncharacterized protein YjbI with pentapeptide repeats